MKLTEFVKELNKWKEERNLTKENQLEGLTPNILEELGELGEAIRNEDIEGQIDALLDILVFFLNSLDEEYIEIVLKSSGYKKLFIKEYCIPIEVIVDNISQTLLYQIDTTLESCIAIIIRFIKDKGYDFELCLDEVMKALHSRKGKYDTNIKKFVKDNSPRYEPDYKKAKL